MTKATEAKLKAQENLRIWNEVCKTDPNHTKKVNQRGGFTAIDAHYQVESATKVFGPIGIGWGYINGEPIFKDSLVFVPVTLWHGDRSNSFGPIYGGAEVISNKGYADNDALKKASTDGLTKALSHLGFNADVFLGKFDDNKYVEAMRIEHAPRPPEMDRLEQFIEETALAQTDDDLQAILELHRAAIDTLAQIKPAEVQRAQQQWKARRKAIRDAAARQLEPAE